jgi:amidase
LAPPSSTASNCPARTSCSENEFPALLTEFKHDLNAYLAATPGEHPADLAGLIEFNRRHAEVEMPSFQQEIFELAQATTGELTDPTYLAQRRAATTAARNAIDSALAANRLDRQPAAARRQA